MVALDSYPTALTDILGENGADFGDAELLAKCDMNKDGAHCDCFLIATAKELFCRVGDHRAHPARDAPSYLADGAEDRRGVYRAFV